MAAGTRLLSSMKVRRYHPTGRIAAIRIRAAGRSQCAQPGPRHLDRASELWDHWLGANTPAAELIGATKYRTPETSSAPQREPPQRDPPPRDPAPRDLPQRESPATPATRAPQREMGAGIAASPHLRRAKDPPVFVSLDDPKVLRSPILAHQLRRRFGKWSCPEGHVLSLPRPFLDQSSFASPASRGKPRFAQERLALPAPLPAGPIQGRSLSSSPAGGDRTFHPFLIHPVVADHPGRLGLPSRSPIPYEPRPESRQAEKACSCLWITGISGVSR